MQRENKTAIVAAGLGFLVAICLGGVWQIANKGSLPANHAALDRVTSYLWPTSLMLMSNENSGQILNGLLLLVSSLANGALYAVLAFSGTTGWRRLRGLPEQSHKA